MPAGWRGCPHRVTEAAEGGNYLLGRRVIPPVVFGKRYMPVGKVRRELPMEGNVVRRELPMVGNVVRRELPMEGNVVRRELPMEGNVV